jgi:hypothetical protein
VLDILEKEVPEPSIEASDDAKQIGEAAFKNFFMLLKNKV